MFNSKLLHCYNFSHDCESTVCDKWYQSIVVMADHEASMRKLEEQDSLIRRLTMELNRLSKGKGVADDGAGGGTTDRTPEDEEIYVELGRGIEPNETET